MKEEIKWSSAEDDKNSFIRSDDSIVIEGMIAQEPCRYHVQFSIDVVLRDMFPFIQNTVEETTTIDPDVEAPVKGKKEEKEALEDIKKRARKPPSEGKCKRCGEHRQLNRQKICYPCFVIINLQKEG